MKSKFCIVARNAVQARQWINDKRATDHNWNHEYPQNSDIIIVSNPDHLRGMTITSGVLLQGWNEIPNIKDIINVLYINTRGNNKKLEEVYLYMQGRP